MWSQIGPKRFRLFRNSGPLAPNNPGLGLEARPFGHRIISMRPLRRCQPWPGEDRLAPATCMGRIEKISPLSSGHRPFESLIIRNSPTRQRSSAGLI